MFCYDFSQVTIQLGKQCLFQRKQSGETTEPTLTRRMRTRYLVVARIKKCFRFSAET